MRFATIMAAGILGIVGVSAAWAGDHGCCDRCGGDSCLRPVCRIVCEMEKVKEVVYDCKCEDFCTLGRSKHCGCQDIPNCKHIRSKKVLVKYEKVTEKPKYKCVVEYVCDGCCQDCDEAAVEPAEMAHAADLEPATRDTSAARTPPIELRAESGAIRVRTVKQPR